MKTVNISILKYSWLVFFGSGVVFAAEIDGWKDTTTAPDGKPSTCAANKSRCTFKQAKSGLFFSPYIGKMNRDQAAEHCKDLSHNGSKLWRLPSSSELYYAYQIEKLGLPGTQFGKDPYWARNIKSGGDIGNTCYYASHPGKVENCYDSNAVHSVLCVQIDLTPHWKDITTDTQGSRSTCGKTPDRCTYLIPAQKLEVTPLIARSDWYTAAGNAARGCNSLNHNGVTGWRLPEVDELRRIVELEAYRLPSIVARSNEVLWTAESDGAEAETVRIDDMDGRHRSREKRTKDIGFICVR